ncbi:hypothetical protein [Pseudomonas farsensis]|uniref:Uncharacterized protein n=1 Tax=Pseudomonas farsensis TaxID=2745492 RepID=A0ABU8QPV5_9PSED
MNDLLHQRLAQLSSLDCRVAKRFSHRPALLETAAELLTEHWQTRQPGSLHDLSVLYLATPSVEGDIWVRPLAQVLVERYCADQTLNLSEGVDFVTATPLPERDAQVELDLHALEILINDIGPLLLETYRQDLIGFWSEFDSSGQTPWQWYANFLRGLLNSCISKSGADASLPGVALAVAKLVHDYPSTQQRSQWPNAAGITVSHLSIDFSADGEMDIELASALLIELDEEVPARTATLVFTLTCRLLSFDSRETMLAALGRHWPDNATASPREVNIVPLPEAVFESMAGGVLDQQLHLIEQISSTYRSRSQAVSLGLDLDRLSSMIELCGNDEAGRRQPLAQQLPDWLRNAPAKALMRYSNLLIDVAQGYSDSAGRFWLDGIDTAEAFANRQLAERFAVDHPGPVPAPDTIEVINHEVVAAALPGAEAPVFSGHMQKVTYSLAQLAIANLGLLKPGRVELRSTTDTALPDWLTEDYLKRLVSELDIANAYPAMLRSKLIDDPKQRKTREQLLALQLRSQLPALAMELHLRGQLDDANAPQRIAQVFAPAAAQNGPRWVIRPLGFIKAPGATVDHPRNTWLIEAQVPGADGVLLYRPLHDHSLLWFADRMALFVAISTPGALQEDLLQRLPAEDRRFYDHGGFNEPHLFMPLDDTSAIPFGAPAPVRIALTDAMLEPAQGLYLACVNEAIARFSEHATSTAQTRWNSWKTLAWLLFNTLLPLAGSTLGKVAWLAQMEVALAEYVETNGDRDPVQKQLTMINLLLNIAMLLFSHSMFRLRLQEAAVSAPAVEPEPATEAVPKEPAPPPRLTASKAVHVQFSWASAGQQLGVAQRSALEALQASVKADTLGTPIPNGPLRGLYLHDTSIYVLLDEKVFEVTLDPIQDQARIVGPSQTPGPWLRLDEAGRWQLDLRLRLQGGQPLSSRLRQMALDKQAALEAVNAKLAADQQLIDAKHKEMKTIDDLVSATTDDTALMRCQNKTLALSEFWSTHLAQLTQRNALGPIKDFKLVQAYALYQQSYCQRTLHKILHQRYRPLRDQLLEVGKQQQAGFALGAEDIRIVRERLDKMAPLLDEMLTNNSSLQNLQAQLGKLASGQQAEIKNWADLANSVPANPTKELVLRFLRLEGMLNRLTLLHGISNEAVPWRQRFWESIELAIAQRARLYSLATDDEEVSSRLLRSIRQQYTAAERQLEMLASMMPEQAAKATLALMKEELQWLAQQTDSDLASLPDYPPTCTLTQLRRKVPGLIETNEHGLLLAEPRAGDENTVDLPGPENKTSGRTYHLKHGTWVQVQTAKAPPPPAPLPSLKHLLKGSVALLDNADTELGKLQKNSSRYLPVEIEESLLHQRNLLEAKADAIEKRLTADNETDEARQGLDAEKVARNLRERAGILQTQATELRIKAALEQPPRMGEVQFLLENAQVQIQPERMRVRLAKVPGRPADYIDEYSIWHKGKVLWYAHFHYPAQDTARESFTEGHLKTAEQRLLKGREVYYYGITHAAALKVFFNS